jgi:hypothetical protein
MVDLHTPADCTCCPADTAAAAAAPLECEKHSSKVNISDKLLVVSVTVADPCVVFVVPLMGVQQLVAASSSRASISSCSSGGVHTPPAAAAQARQLQQPGISSTASSNSSNSASSSNSSDSRLGWPAQQQLQQPQWGFDSSSSRRLSDDVGHEDDQEQTDKHKNGQPVSSISSRGSTGSNTSGRTGLKSSKLLQRCTSGPTVRSASKQQQQQHKALLRWR